MKVKIFLFLILFAVVAMAAIVNPPSLGSTPSVKYSCENNSIQVQTDQTYVDGYVSLAYQCAEKKCGSCNDADNGNKQQKIDANGVAIFKSYGAGIYEFVAVKVINGNIIKSGPFYLSGSQLACFDPATACNEKSDVGVEFHPYCKNNGLRFIITDANKNPLKDAKISVKNPSGDAKEYTTNAEGRSDAANLEMGINELKVDAQGHDTKTVTVDYGKGKYACPDCKIEVLCNEKKVKFTCSADPSMANQKLTVNQLPRPPGDEYPSQPPLTSAIGTAGEELTTASFAGATVPSTSNALAVRSIPKNVRLNNVRVARADILNGRVTGKANNIVWKNLNTKSLLATFVQNGVKRTVNLNGVQINNALASRVRVRNLEITRGTAQNIVVSNRVANGAEAPATCPRPDRPPTDGRPEGPVGSATEGPAGRPEVVYCPGTTQCAEGEIKTTIYDTGLQCTQITTCMPGPTAPTTVATTDNAGAANIPLPERGSYEATTEDGKIFPIDIESVCKRATDIYCSKEKKGRFKVSTLDQENSEPRPTRVKLTKSMADTGANVINSFKATFLENGFYSSTSVIITPDQCINEGDRVPGGKVDCGGLDGGDFDGDLDGGNGNGGTATNCEIEGGQLIGTDGQPVGDNYNAVSIVRVEGGTLKGENCEIEGGTNDGGSVSGGSSSGGSLSGGTPTDLAFPEEFTAYPDEIEVETDEAGEVFVGPTGPEPEPPPSQPIKYDLITGDKINVGEQFTARALKNDESCVLCTIVVTDSTGKEILRVTTDANGEALLSLANKGTYEVALLSEEGEVAKRKQVEAELAITPPAPEPKPPTAGDQSMLLYGIIVVVIVIVAYFILKKKK